MKALLLAGACCFVAMFSASGAPPCSVLQVRISVKFVLDAANHRPASGAYITDNQVRTAITEANEALANNAANFRLDLVEILDVPGISQWFGPLSCFDASFRTMEAQAEANPGLYRWRTDAVNIYVIGSLSNCGGLCAYPGGGDDMIWINSQGISSIGWLHELGHYFNLVHTFDPNPAPTPCGAGDCSGATCPDVCPDTFNVMSYNCNIAVSSAVLTACQLSIMASEMDPTAGRRRAVVYCTDLPNDACAGAIPMTAGTSYTMSTTMATSSGDPTPSCLSGFGKGVWYQFTPSISGIVTINTCASDFNTAIVAYAGTCASPTPVVGGCNNDMGPSCGTTRASVSFTGTAGSTYRILAGGAGGSSGTLSIVATVAPPKQDQAITFPPLGNKIYRDPPFSVSATASSGLPVSFSIVSGPATIAGNIVSINGAGTVTVRASQPGDSTYNPAPNVNRAFTVAKANQAIVFGPLENRSLGEPPFSVDAVASSGLPVSFSIPSGPATISGQLVTLLNTGTVTVRALQSGNANYSPAPNIDQPFSVYARPSLTIIRSRENVLIAWSTNVSGYVLQSASSLAPTTSWNTVLSNPVIVNGQNTATLSATGNIFYRLRK